MRALELMTYIDSASQLDKPGSQATAEDLSLPPMSGHDPVDNCLSFWNC